MAQRLHWHAPATGLAALVLFLLLGWDTFAGAASGAHERGRAIYNFRCYFCHGYAGDARTLAAGMLSPSPRDFTAGGLDENGRPRPETRRQVLDQVRAGRLPD